jgi:hypothetical protein
MKTTEEFVVNIWHLMSDDLLRVGSIGLNGAVGTPIFKPRI